MSRDESPLPLSGPAKIDSGSYTPLDNRSPESRWHAECSYRSPDREEAELACTCIDCNDGNQIQNLLVRDRITVGQPLEEFMLVWTAPLKLALLKPGLLRCTGTTRTTTTSRRDACSTTPRFEESREFWFFLSLSVWSIMRYRALKPASK